MKKFIVLFVAMLLCLAARSQTNVAAETQNMLFGSYGAVTVRDTFWVMPPSYSFDTTNVTASAKAYFYALQFDADTRIDSLAEKIMTATGGYTVSWIVADTVSAGTIWFGNFIGGHFRDATVEDGNPKVRAYLKSPR